MLSVSLSRADEESGEMVGSGALIIGGLLPLLPASGFLFGAEVTIVPVRDPERRARIQRASSVAGRVILALAVLLLLVGGVGLIVTAVM
ncbi:MAG: hypothetical protein ACJ76P_13280 [Actinomycetota bacterium]